MTITLTATMFNRTIVTEHATIDEAHARVLAIATAQQCTIEADTELAGQFIPQTTTHGTHGTYQIEQEPTKADLAEAHLVATIAPTAEFLAKVTPVGGRSKTTYIATAPDGTEFTRTTKTRVYTHAVLVFVRETESDRGPHWGLISFNSREELAHDEARRWAGGTRISGDVWAEPIVVKAIAQN